MGPGSADAFGNNFVAQRPPASETSPSSEGDPARASRVGASADCARQPERAKTVRVDAALAPYTGSPAHTASAPPLTPAHAAGLPTTTGSRPRRNDPPTPPGTPTRRTQPRPVAVPRAPHPAVTPPRPAFHHRPTNSPAPCQLRPTPHSSYQLHPGIRQARIPAEPLQAEGGRSACGPQRPGGPHRNLRTRAGDRLVTGGRRMRSAKADRRFGACGGRVRRRAVTAGSGGRPGAGCRDPGQAPPEGDPPHTVRRGTKEKYAPRPAPLGNAPNPRRRAPRPPPYSPCPEP
ncbi:hypothetical protein GA0115251_13249 [Streptomyces sp. TverLS-915]|nr:hypothetical protein GA0115251_13249 [Streptomyces sp. TverLS-915]